jgi:hypothetical protein
MVKVLFVVEGKVEKIFIDYLHDTKWFEQFGIQKVGPTINAKGGGNLCLRNIDGFIEQARTYTPDKIVILAALECDPCIEETKKRLGNCEICKIIIARKAIEAWFLADDDLLIKLSDQRCAHYNYPENTSRMPYDTFKLLAKRLGVRRGPGSKAMFIKRVLREGFNIKRAAAHENCRSAMYFVEAMRGIGDGGD